MFLVRSPVARTAEQSGLEVGAAQGRQSVPERSLVAVARTAPGAAGTSVAGRPAVPAEHTAAGQHSPAEPERIAGADHTVALPAAALVEPEPHTGSSLRGRQTCRSSRHPRMFRSGG